jgi:GNAT superfamily N-acetyltransferase
VDARVATPDDLDAIAETLALAFNRDPVWAWAFPDDERRLEQHRAAWRLTVASAIPHGWVWMTADGGAAAVWIPPGEPELSPEDEIRFAALLQERASEDGAARVLDTFERFEAAHPHDRGPHYYLSLLGTHPDHAGQGLGMGLLAGTLARIDTLGAAAFLESSNPANDRRYERLGFSPCGRFELDGDGPDVTQMWRDPAA